MEEAAHDQPVVYVEGRSDNHSEADALVHVQLICGLANHMVYCLCQHCGFNTFGLGAILAAWPRFQGPLSATGSGVSRSSAGR
jgi:hypothetical protein